MGYYQTREALARREEMMQAIGRRMDGSGGTPRARPRTLMESSSSSSSLGAGSSSPKAQEVARSIEDIAIEADGKLAQALRTQEEVASGMKNLLTQLQEVSMTRPAPSSVARMLTPSPRQKSTALTAANIELANVKMQRDVFSDLIKDKNAEVDVLYEVSHAPQAPPLPSADGDQSFNEELQGMYEDATLPEDEAWAAMTRDLKAAKKSEKAVRHENQ